MQRIKLGNTDIEVSRLCFGSLTMTPFQAGLSVSDGAYLIEYAYNKGINFIDTAEIYENYDYIKLALKGIKREDFVISTKSYAYTEEMARESLDLALKELDTDYIDIFLLHEQESIHTVRGHFDAIEYFLKQKEKGKIRSIGISTHRISGALAAKQVKEIEILHPIVNKKGIGIQDGNIDEMIEMLRKVKKVGKGIYAMKPLGGGHLIKEATSSFNFVKNIDVIDSIAIGMQSTTEIDANIELLEKGFIREELKNKLKHKKRNLIVADYCVGCGRCVKRCKQNGIEVVNGKATANDKCILCGYCAKVCPEFCIKVI